MLHYEPYKKQKYTHPWGKGLEYEEGRGEGRLIN
jgi:hypothetical protein